MGIPLISNIETQGAGGYPLYRDTDGYGGYQVRLNTTDRDAIPTLNRKTGMKVFVIADGYEYRLVGGITNGDWQIVNGDTAGNDLTGTYPNPTVARIRNNNIAAETLTAARDGYVLTWLNTDGYWASRPLPSSNPTGPAGGDLGGTYPNPIVTALQTFDVHNITPTDGYVLTWINADGYWAPRPTEITPDATSTIKGKLKLTNDLSGTADLPVVAKLNGVTAPNIAPITDQILVATSGTQLVYSKIFDGYIDSAANITGSKISSATTLDFGVIKLAGDIGGTATSVLVTKLQTNPINNQVLGASQDGYALLWLNSDGYWAARPRTPVGGAGGDLSGTYPNPTVSRLEGNDVATETLNAARDGYILTWINADGYWASRPAPSVTPIGTAGGDLTGSYPNPNVKSLTGTAGVVQVNANTFNLTSNFEFNATTDGYINFQATQGAQARIEANSNFHTYFGRRVRVDGYSANTVLNDTHHVVRINSSGGAVTIFLPASPATGQVLMLKDTGNAATNNITIDGNGKLIDGSSTYPLTINYQSIVLVYSGTVWDIF